MNQNACCFFGHRKIKTTSEMKEKLYNILKKLITEEKIDTFLFGSKSQFDDLCHQIISDLRKDYPYIKRIYVRAEFPYINSHYKSYLLQRYEETYYPIHITKAGKAAYIERNFDMINKSKYCIVYFDEDYSPPKQSINLSTASSKSGTKIAYNYAKKKEKIIINILMK